MDLKEIEKYIFELQTDELKFKNQDDKATYESAVNAGRGISDYLKLGRHILLSVVDYILSVLAGTTEEKLCQ